MTYQRSVIFESALLSWQRVRLQVAQPGWSDDYRVEGPRLVLPLQRSFECRLGAGSFVCDASTALWLAPGQAYRMRRPWADPCSVLLGLDADRGPSRRAAAPLWVHLQLARWQQLLAARQAEPLHVEEGLAGLVRALLPATGGAETMAGRSQRAVERAREYIAAEPQRSDTLADIARAAHCSPFHLARCFRQHTGHSLHGLRTRLRMALALERLRQGERNLSALAADLGYASHSHFSTVFRRSLGSSPSQMRTNLAALMRG